MLPAAAPPPAAPPTKAIALRDFAFQPEAARIRPGGRIRFVWRDDLIPHNVKSVGTRRFAMIPTRKTGSVLRTFRRVGTYRFFCTIHTGMTGRIVVRR